MKSIDAHSLNIGQRLTLTFIVLIALILGGNALIVWQFHIAHIQTARLTGTNQQLIVVLRLQATLLSFRQRLDGFAQTKDASRLNDEIEPLRRGLLEQTQDTRIALASLPSETSVDPAFLPTIEAIEITLPSQLKSIAELASSGDWEAVQSRLANELKPMEAQTSALVESIEQEVSDELKQAVANMSSVHRRILVIVPVTAISTFVIATFFGWSMAGRIIEVRFDERANERLRITRELHDTLLQTIQGSKLVADDALESRSDSARMTRALEQLSVWLERATYEGRTALNSLRESTREKNDLAEAFRRSIKECQRHSSIEGYFSVCGKFREMHPVVRDEIYRIGDEGIRNACAHSHASRLEVYLSYARALTLRVIDNGIGIDSQVMYKGKDEHFGLQGMRERAERIGAQLTITSSANMGTEVKLVVPGRIIFRKPSTSRIERVKSIFGRASHIAGLS